MAATEEQKSEYLKAIGFEGPLDNSFQTLKKIVEGHIFTFPFETINLHDSSLDDSNDYPDRCTGTHFNPIFRRAVQEKRGGHCVALNILLQTMLSSFGFNVNPILPEVLWEGPKKTKKPIDKPIEDRSKHCAAVVTVGEDKYLVDAAFGSIGLLSPLPLKPGEYQQYSEKFRLTSNQEKFECQVWSNERWESIFRFTQQTALISDYKAINNIESNPLHPKCTFTNLFVCSKPFKIDDTHSGRYRICNSTFITLENEIEVYRTIIRSQDKLQEILKKYFNIDLHGHIIRYPSTEQTKYLQANPVLAHEPEPILDLEPQPMLVNLYSLLGRRKKYQAANSELPVPDVAMDAQRKKATLNC